MLQSGGNQVTTASSIDNIIILLYNEKSTLYHHALSVLTPHPPWVVVVQRCTSTTDKNPYPQQGRWLCPPHTPSTDPRPSRSRWSNVRPLHKAVASCRCWLWFCCSACSRCSYSTSCLRCATGGSIGSCRTRASRTSWSSMTPVSRIVRSSPSLSRRR